MELSDSPLVLRPAARGSIGSPVKQAGTGSGFVALHCLAGFEPSDMRRNSAPFRQIFRLFLHLCESA